MGIDPGTTQSAYAVWLPESQTVHACGIHLNEELLNCLKYPTLMTDVIAIEMVASYGMPVGREVFETVLWIGRFFERCIPQPRLVYRRDVKLHHCQSPRAKDGNIRQALIDKYGPVGTKKQPGPFYGVKSHIWAAVALATFISETSNQ